MTRLLRHLTAAVCLYEVVAIWTEWVPTLSRITYRHRHDHRRSCQTVWAVVALGLAWHLFYQEYEWISEVTPGP